MTRTITHGTDEVSVRGVKIGVDWRKSATRRKCVQCGEHHITRLRRPGWCLKCDVRDRAEHGEAAASIAHDLRMPVFLIREVIR